MQTIQIVLDEDLLTAADRAAKQQQVNRSALFREALRAYLKRLRVQEMEARDRAGYESDPDKPGELDTWERVAAWPEA